MTVRLGCVTHGMSHGVQLKVTDDGGGFDVPAAMIGRHTGMGLRLMRVAVGLAGGDVIIVSSAARRNLCDGNAAPGLGAAAPLFRS